MAKARQLTEIGIERMRATAERIEVPDTRMPGLRLIIQPSGRKSWAFRYRLHGKTAKFTIGSYPAFSLADARKAAGDAEKAIARGRHPLMVKRATEADTVEAVVADWLKRDQAGNRSHDAVKRLFDNEVLPRWKDLPVSSITPDDAEAIIDRIADRGAVTSARRTYAHLHRFFRWCVMKRKVPVNPLAAVEKPGTENVRDRRLDENELRRVWLACDILGYPFGPAYRLLILTGCRRNEILHLRWSEVDFDNARIDLEGARTKNGKRHVIPLSGTALDILTALPRVGDERDGFVFTTTGRTPVSGFSRAKRRLDKAVAEIDPEGKPLDGPDPMPAWRTHDLRHTFVTETNDKGLADPHVIEAFVNHLSGHRQGIAGRYNHAAYLPQRVELARRWAAHVAGLVGDAAAENVVPLRA